MFCETVRELAARDPERGDEGQVEEQLERRGGAVRFVLATARHAPQAVLVVGR